MNFLKLIILSLFVTNMYAGTREFENSFVNKNIDNNASKFISQEIAISIQKSVVKYNSNRKDIDTLKTFFVNSDEIKVIENLIKQQKELPEIKLIDGMYTVSLKNIKLQFDSTMLLKKSFLLDGQMTKFKSSLELSLLLSKKISLINLLIESAYASFESDPETTRLLLASVISLNNIFEKTGMTCMVSCDQVKINFQKLLDKLADYNNACNEALAVQNASFERGKQIDYLANVSLIGDPSFTEGLKIDELFKAMNYMAVKKSEISSNLKSKLYNELDEKTCEKQMMPFMKNGLFHLKRLTKYGSSDSETVDTSTVAYVCGGMDQIKSCMNDLYKNNVTISQTMRQKGNSTPDTRLNNLESRGFGK